MRSEYEAVERLSNTGMGHLKRSPLHYRYWRDNAKASEATSPALVAGIAAHMAILEPHRFSKEYESMPDVSHLTPGQKAGVTKAIRSMTKGSEKKLITYDSYQDIIGMRDAVAANRAATELLNCEREVEYFWTDKGSGALCKGRVDAINIGAGYIADLKTTENASEEAFKGSIYKYSLYRQAAFYMSAAEGINKFYWVVVEKNPPYGVAIYSIDRHNKFFDMGEEEYSYCCSVYAHCISSGIWEGYNVFPNAIDCKQQGIKSDWLSD